jgi:AraC-like DNA-binding protein
VVHRARTAEGLAGLYRESCAIVLRHYRRALTVAVVARALASSPRQVQRAFEEVGGDHVQRLPARGSPAQRRGLLARQPLTVRQVSLLVGYRQPAHFAKAFRRRFGVTPARYRDRARSRAARQTTTRRHGGRLR